jgi:hypothetical protein
MMILKRWSLLIFSIFCGTLPYTLEAKAWIKLEAEDFTIMSEARQSQVIEFAVEYAVQRYAVCSFFAKPGIKTPRSNVIFHDPRKDKLKYVSDTARGSETTRFRVSTMVDGRMATALSLESNRQNTL